MKNPYQQILWLYVRNQGFVFSLGIFLLTAFLSKTFQQIGNGYYAEEFFTLLFVSSLWLVFHLGILLKRQFSSHRASLLPKYRAAHILVAFASYFLFMLVVYLWMFWPTPASRFFETGLGGIYWTCALLTLLIIYLGYLSIGRILLYAYMVVLIFAGYSFDILSVFNRNAYSFQQFFPVGLGLFLFLFARRLFFIKEESVEYGYIFSWPPRSFIIGQLKASERISHMINPLANLLRTKKQITEIPPYPRTRNIFSRAYHWNYTEYTDFKVIWVLILLLASLFLFIVSKQPGLQSFNKDVYSNFLLLTMSPVLVAMGTNYKRIAYAAYDFLKPVNKQEYMKEQAIILCTKLFLYWLLLTVSFAILPNIIFHPELFSTRKFWAYLALTANVSFIVLCWAALLSCVLNPIRVIANGFILSLIVMFYFYSVPRFSFAQMLFHNVICMAGAVFLLSKAYQLWCEKEFLE